MSNNIHITFDPLADQLFQRYFAESESDEQFYVFKDYLNEGPLRSDVGVNFDQARAEYYYRFYQFTDKQLAEIPTIEKDILVFSNRMSNGDEAEIILWMGNNELDVIGYFFILHFLKKHAHNISIINISGLPFIDVNGKLFFPKRIAHLDTAGMKKALSLKRKITPTEIEIDSDEWKTLRDQNTELRLMAGNKKIQSVSFEPLISAIHEHFLSNSRQAKNTQIINDKLGAVLSDRLIMKKALDEGLTKRDKNKMNDEDDNQMSLGL